MVDLRVVEVVENVLVRVLGVEADEVVPCADVVADLGAGPADVQRVLRLLHLSDDCRMMRSESTGAVSALTVSVLVGWIEQRQALLS